ncbi:MAG TPA: hypothetical protein VK167_15240 [Flavipsychrobacter sp.]|jgi:hypothetical protein|nr:hypothetical protein [Chitinophagales bacterium]HLO72228.1 hypothetical protein [Flavipsychrobacter sp.]
MRTILYILFFIFIASCNTHNNKYLFDFDEATHYYYEIEEDSLMNMWTKENKTDKEKKIINLLIDDIPYSIKDSSSVKNLERYGFIKKQISNSDKSKLREAIRRKKVADFEETTCIAEYRDIIIFKKNHKIVGVIKICFGCDQYLIIDSRGQKQDYEEHIHMGILSQILHPNN